MADISIVCRVSDANGDWVYLNEAPFRLASESLAEEATQWRKDIAENPNVEGAWVVNALRSNTQSALSIWVTGTDQVSCADGIDQLKALFSQLNYVLQISYNGDRHTYQCYVSDFVVKAQRELRISNMAMFTVMVDRHPDDVRDAG